MNRLLAAAPVLLLLPAAGSSLPIKPGKWQSTVTVTDVQMQNAPPGVGQAMHARPTTVTACVTAAQAADGPRAVLQGSNGKCHYTSFNASGGRFNAVLQCAFGRGAMTMTSTSNGTYTATSMDVTGSSSAMGRMRMTTKTHTVGRWLGPC